MTNWIEDLFGGQDKGWIDKQDGHEGRMSRTADDIVSSKENKTKDYPHYTRENKSDWHRSEDKNTHSDSWNLNDDSRYSEPVETAEFDGKEYEVDEYGCKKIDLFDPGTWM